MFSWTIKVIITIKKTNNSNLFIVESKMKEIVGYLIAIGGNAKRNKHSAYIVIGISKYFRGQGLGTKLLIELEEWTTQQGIHRLELTVVIHNKAGLLLYEKMGFEVEGIKRDSLFIDGGFVDDYYMSKLINTNHK